ncbi:MAG: hypothetical protein AB1782_03855 [Cyanobacteriota bacterium]
MSSIRHSYKIMGEMGIGDAISRGWRLYNLYFKKVILYSLIGTPLLLLANILVNFPSVFAENPELLGISCCCFYPVGLSFLFIGAFIAILFNFCLVKAFYNILIGESVEYIDIFNFAKKNLGRLLKFCTLIFLEFVTFYILDSFLIVILVLFVAIIPIFLGGVVGNNNETLGFIAGLTTCILMGIVMLIFSFFVLYQFLICFLQLVIAATEETTLFKSLVKSVDLVAHSLTRSGFFIFSLLTLWYAIVLFFNFPPLVYSFYELFKDGITTASGTLPMHILIITTLWGFFVNMLTWPWVVSAVTIFYYDTKVRTEGLDLKQTLALERKEYSSRLNS